MNDHPTRRTFVKQTAAAAASVTFATAQVCAGAPAAFRGKFSICNETFKDWAFDKAFAFAAEAGYAGTEIAPFTVSNDVTDISAARRREIRRQAEKAGLEVVGLHWLLARTKGLHLTSPDRAVRRKTTAYLGALAEFCAELGGKILVFGSPKQRDLEDGVSRTQGMAHATEVFREALPALEKADVRLAIEPLSPRTTNFIRTAAEGAELVERIGSPRCRLILDCLAMSSEKTPIPDLIRRHRRLLVHLHANDPNAKGPGFGDLDFVPIFRALRDVSFRDWVSVEVFDYAPGPERLARESIAYLKKCLAMVRASA